MTELETFVIGGMQAARSKIERALAELKDPHQGLQDALGPLVSVQDRLDYDSSVVGVLDELGAFLGAFLALARGLAAQVASLKEQASGSAVGGPRGAGGVEVGGGPAPPAVTTKPPPVHPDMVLPVVRPAGSSDDLTAYGEPAGRPLPPIPGQ